MTEQTEDDHNAPQNTVSESEFYMWRAVFAMAHADDEVTESELKFMNEILEKHNFSTLQKDLLKNDIENKQDISSFFSFITEQKHRSQFFRFARMLCWTDGDFDAQEQAILTKLERMNIQSADFDNMIGTIDLELDEEEKSTMKKIIQDPAPEGGFIEAFFRRFTRDA